MAASRRNGEPKKKKELATYRIQATFTFELKRRRCGNRTDQMYDNAMGIISDLLYGSLFLVQSVTGRPAPSSSSSRHHRHQRPPCVTAPIRLTDFS